MSRDLFPREVAPGARFQCWDTAILLRHCGAVFLRHSNMVGAAMCSAFRCGSHDRVPRFNSGRGLQYLAHVPTPHEFTLSPQARFETRSNAGARTQCRARSSKVSSESSGSVTDRRCPSRGDRIKGRPTSEFGPLLPSQPRRATSTIGVRLADICSMRVLRILDPLPEVRISSPVHRGLPLASSCAAAWLNGFPLSRRQNW